MFDSVIFAPWPKGLYLAKQLSEEGRKVAYVEILPRSKNPFGLFLDEQSKEEKEFLETLGFLFRQEGGFCLLSPEGVWPLQDMREMADRHPVLKNKLSEDSFKDFKNHWLSYLSLNLAGKVFEYNNSEFSKKSLNLFSDYFLFEASFKKIDQFQKDHSHIVFYKLPLEGISFDETDLKFLVQNKALRSKDYFWLGGNHFSVFKENKNCEPYWQWSACFLNVDFGDYEEIIPSHFVSIRHLFLPWSHDNMLSVFHKKGELEVWIKKAYKKEQQSFVKEVKEHLESFFPGCVFSSIEKKPLKGPIVYSKESLKYSATIEDQVYIQDLNDCFQADIVSEIRAERDLFKSL